MPHFGRKSREVREQLVPELQEILDEAIKQIDFSNVIGIRSKKEQNRLFKGGSVTNVKWPHSKHNIRNEGEKSRAVDVCIYPPPKSPEDWEDEKTFWRFCFLAGTIMAIGRQKGIELIWGGDWNGDHLFNEGLIDMLHFEVKNNKKIMEDG